MLGERRSRRRGVWKLPTKNSGVGGEERGIDPLQETGGREGALEKVGLMTMSQSVGRP